MLTGGTGYSSISSQLKRRQPARVLDDHVFCEKVRFCPVIGSSALPGLSSQGISVGPHFPLHVFEYFSNIFVILLIRTSLRWSHEHVVPIRIHILT